MQVIITVGNFRKRDAKEAVGKYQESGNNRTVTRQTRAYSDSDHTDTQRHDWGTRVHELAINDNKQDDRK